MSTYAVIQDMVDRFGQEEMIQLTDRATIQTNAINTTLLQAKMDDAEAELKAMLSCCYDLKVIAQIYIDGGFIPVLKHWECDITRKHLYDSLENADHEVIREYDDFKKEIMNICKCENLITDEDEVVPKKTGAFYVLDEPGCYPKAFPCGCCSTNPCQCSNLGNL